MFQASPLPERFSGVDCRLKLSPDWREIELLVCHLSVKSFIAKWEATQSSEAFSRPRVQAGPGGMMKPSGPVTPNSRLFRSSRSADCTVALYQWWDPAEASVIVPRAKVGAPRGVPPEELWVHLSVAGAVEPAHTIPAAAIAPIATAVAINLRSRLAIAEWTYLHLIETFAHPIR
jgi:hypothetical protein